MAKTTLSIKTFIQCAEVLPSNISVLIRGKHGIGKSQIVGKLAKTSNMKLIDRRLSQMSEGDMIGLPEIKDGSTRFCPPDWFMMACNEPVVLFLDEFNRALPEVMQAAFQIVLDRELNGHKLHPGTRVFAAVNMGAEYTVNEMDPALLRRFWTVDLEPSPEEWVENFARGNLSDTITDFIAANTSFLDPPKGADLTHVHTTRHSWERLDTTLKHIAKQLDSSESDILNCEHALFYPTCCGFIGVEAALAFKDFAKNVDRRVTGEEILNSYSKVREKVMKLGQEKWNICVEKLVDEINKLPKLTKKQEDNIVKFMEDLPAESRVVLWEKVTNQGTDRVDVLKSLWKKLVPFILNVFGITPGDPNAKPIIPDFLQKKQS